MYPSLTPNLKLTPSSNINQYVVVLALLLLFCVLETNCKPSVGGLRFRGPFAPPDESRQNLKNYTGRRVSDSIRMVYFHDQTVAVVELGPRKLLLNCEVIEVFKPEQYSDVLGDLAKTARPVGITFLEMLTLMDQCKELEEISGTIKRSSRNSTTNPFENARGILANDPFTLFRGIIPGTKWCGTGDIAKNYYDLGTESSVDVCCRTHDLCPVKVRSRSHKYNLSNNSLYTKSHCACDEHLYDCLKKQQDAPIANIMGSIYFNLASLECVADGKEGRIFRRPRRRF
ncbi:uncharacterized protein [Euwallacea similis]|uniref:uncharacterized protein n=1 Tax=Euwallacea similis TaxID=1736056 RepID=UPI00344B182F